MRVLCGGRDLRGGKLYVVLHPCQECAKAIIQAGIREVYYLSDKYADLDETKISKRMLETAGVKSTHMTDYPKQIILDFEKKI